ncbi:MAG: 3'-5' exonuclease, partial [Thermoguttaceae bacterium]
NRIKYRTDLENFIKESNYEDFYDDEREVTYVSTIHKSKGREFDAVYLMLCGNVARSDEEKRKLYVGMTRAKDSLYIHCNTDLFSSFDLPGVAHFEDNNEYGEPEDIFLELTYRDVVLDFFKNKKELVFQLKSGVSLFLTGAFLSAELKGRSAPIVKLSKACRERLQTLYERGYVPYSASVRFIVAWKGKDDAEETAVVLPEISLRKRKSTANKG